MVSALFSVLFNVVSSCVLVHSPKNCYLSLIGFHTFSHSFHHLACVWCVGVRFVWYLSVHVCSVHACGLCGVWACMCKYIFEDEGEKSEMRREI